MRVAPLSNAAAAAGANVNDNNCCRQTESRMHYRLGVNQGIRDINEEINEYLSTAIESRSVEQLYQENCHRITLRFMDATLQEKFSSQRDPYFSIQIVCVLLVFLLAVFGVQLLTSVSHRSMVPVYLFSLVTLATLSASAVAFATNTAKIPSRIWWCLFIHGSIMAALAACVIPISVSTLQNAKIDDLKLNRSQNWSEHCIALGGSPLHIALPKYSSISISLTLFSLTCFAHSSFLWKAIISTLTACAYLTFCQAVNPYAKAYEVQSKCGCTHMSLLGAPPWVQSAVHVGCSVLTVAVHAYLVEFTVRLDFLWKYQANEEKIATEQLRARNRKLVNNILPQHVAEHFLNFQFTNNPEDLYSEFCNETTVIFASISNFSEFYMELSKANEDVQCLILLNEIISDFDDLLRQFSCMEKIKTIGSTYMAASGLSRGTTQANHGHTAQVADFALALLQLICLINRHSFNEFKMRIGINHGDVIAGVIGARKPQYDIWGDTVNIASRMDSTGVDNKIQVTGRLKEILEPKDYTFSSRGLISVRGVKNQLNTYFLLSGPNDAMHYVRQSRPDIFYEDE